MKLVVTLHATDPADLASLSAPPLAVTLRTGPHEVEVRLDDTAPPRPVPYRLQGRRLPPDDSPLGGLARIDVRGLDEPLECDHAPPSPSGLADFDDL